MNFNLEPFRKGILQGNCLEILPGIPDCSVDAVITDPPYSSGGMTSGARQADPVKRYQQGNQKLQRPTFQGDNRDQRSWGYRCTLWITECLRILNDGGYFLMFSDLHQVPTATDALQAGGCILIARDKTEGARSPNKAYFRHRCEYIIWGSKGGHFAKECRPLARMPSGSSKAER